MATDSGNHSSTQPASRSGRAPRTSPNKPPVSGSPASSSTSSPASTRSTNYDSAPQRWTRHKPRRLSRARSLRSTVPTLSCGLTAMLMGYIGSGTQRACSSPPIWLTFASHPPRLAGLASMRDLLVWRVRFPRCLVSTLRGRRVLKLVVEWLWHEGHGTVQEDTEKLYWSSREAPERRDEVLGWDPEKTGYVPLTYLVAKCTSQSCKLRVEEYYRFCCQNLI